MGICEPHGSRKPPSGLHEGMYLGLTAKYLMWVIIVVLIQDGSEHVQPTV